MTVKLSIEIISPITPKDHAALRNATMALLAIANEEIGLIQAPEEEPEEGPPAPPDKGLN